MAISDSPIYRPTLGRPVKDISIVLPFVVNNPVIREITANVSFIEHIGNDHGAPIDVSVNKNEWTRLFPGESLEGLEPTGYIYVRNPNRAPASGNLVAFIRYGNGIFNRRDSIGISRDGRHPQSFQVNAVGGAAVAIQEFSDVCVPVIPDSSLRRPHIKSIALHNEGATDSYLRLSWSLGTVIPVPGANGPMLTFRIPAHGDLNADFSRGIGSWIPLTQAPVAQEYLYGWITKLDADLDTTPSDGAVRGVIAIS